jgi:hypothetical protein
MKSHGYPSGERSPDGRWEIRSYISKDFAAYFESETRWDIEIVNIATNDVVASFTYSEFGNSSGWEYSGAERLEFTPDSSAVVVKFVDGRTETVALPSAGK